MCWVRTLFSMYVHVIVRRVPVHANFADKSALAQFMCLLYRHSTLSHHLQMKQRETYRRVSWYRCYEWCHNMRSWWCRFPATFVQPSHTLDGFMREIRPYDEWQCAHERNGLPAVANSSLPNRDSVGKVYLFSQSCL